MGEMECSFQIVNPILINEKLKEVSEKINCAAKVYLALRFILRNVDTDECLYLYAHENNTFEKSHLLCPKGYLISFQDRVEKMDPVETCAQEKEKTKRSFALTTNSDSLSSPKEHFNGMYRCCSS